jgi:hypothetical protein
MDAFTRLALMAKAKRVFESDDTFLSFPALSPIGYEADELTFAAPGEMTPQSLALMSEFARITNAIPRGAIAPQEEAEYLWDVYRDVLETAHLAKGDLSADEAARYEAAMSLLYKRSAEGVSSDSDAYTVYKQHRDAHIAALENYRNGQLTAESSDDPVVQARWRNEQEPHLREEVAQYEERWRTDGRKADIEEALQIEQACAAHAPSLIWDQWKSSFIADLDTQTDTSLIDFAATSFSPYDFFDDAWPQFTLTRPEMKRLVETAPSELVESLGSSAPEDIEGVSFEYRSVAVMRPWFRPALFKSRIWRLPHGAEALSEGTAALRGRCPAYIAAIVFARNISLEQRPAAVAPPAHIANAQRTELRAPRRRPVVRDHRDRTRTHAASGVRRVVIQPSTRPRADRRSTHGSTPRPVVRVNRSGFASMRSLNDRPIRKVPSAPLRAPETTPSSELTVLAFICKRVPKCPDPDLQLSWYDGAA